MPECKVHDEDLVRALIGHDTKRAAAAAMGISTSALYKRMKKPEFKKVYKSAQQAQIMQSKYIDTFEITIDTILDLMKSEKPEAIRLQAAQMLLQSAGKLAEQLPAICK